MCKFFSLANSYGLSQIQLQNHFGSRGQKLEFACFNFCIIASNQRRNVNSGSNSNNDVAIIKNFKELPINVSIVTQPYSSSKRATNQQNVICFDKFWINEFNLLLSVCFSNDNLFIFLLYDNIEISPDFNLGNLFV